MGKCIDRLIAGSPRGLWVDIAEAADGAFGEAAHLADRYVEDPERSNMLGQLRHARLEAGLRRAAKAHDVTVATPHTTPRGGRYSLVSFSGINMIRGNVQTHRGPPRPTKFREAIATANRWLSPLQPDFFLRTVEPGTERLCAVLVVTAQRRGNPSLPAWVGIGFPHHDLSSWAEINSVTDILARYHDAETRAAVPFEAVVEVRDRAIPQIKPRRSSGDGTA